MSRTAMLLWCLMLAACAGAIGYSARKEQLSGAAAAQAIEEARRVEADVREFQRAIAERPAWMERGAPDAELAKQLGTTLATQGLPATALSNVEPDTAAPAGRLGDPRNGPIAKRSRATVTLRGLTLPQLGVFLDAWRHREGQWSIASIRLEPERFARIERTGIAARGPKGAVGDEPGRTAPKPGDDLPLNIVLSLEHLHVDWPVGARQSSDSVIRAAREAGIDWPLDGQVPASIAPGSRSRQARPIPNPTSAQQTASPRARPANIREGQPR